MEPKKKKNLNTMRTYNWLCNCHSRVKKHNFTQLSNCAELTVLQTNQSIKCKKHRKQEHIQVFSQFSLANIHTD